MLRWRASGANGLCLFYESTAQGFTFIFAHGIVWVGVYGTRAFSTGKYVASTVSDIMMTRTTLRNNLRHCWVIARMTRREYNAVYARVQIKNVLLSLQRVRVPTKCLVSRTSQIPNQAKKPTLEAMLLTPTYTFRQCA